MRTALALALTLALAAGSAQVARADDDTDRLPTRQEVRDARHDVDVARLDLRGVQDALDAADARLTEASIAAAQAAEAFNGARYEARLARLDARRAAGVAREAAGAAERQRRAYRGAMLSSYTHGSGLGALTSVVESDGLSELVQRSATMRSSKAALEARYDDLRAAQSEAEEAQDAADAALERAEDAEDAAREARDAAGAAEQHAAALAQEVADDEQELLDRLAELQGISIELATQRRNGLEARQARLAARAARQARAAELAERARDAEQEQAEQPEEARSEGPDPTPSTSPTAPAPTGDAQAAIEFARAQLGDPYRWAASGPDAWDCSGLTSAAWAAGGKDLPHYSVAQYEQSTPIDAADLRPGDLVFWGSSSSPSSIYHVALYVGDDRIIHAPRTGRPVSEESMYYWIPPTFFARP